MTAKAARPPLNAERRNEIARGYALVGVFLSHVMFPVIYGPLTVTQPAQSELTFAIGKLAYPHVSLFFILSGMTARAIGKRGFAAVAQQSLMLFLIGIVSHILCMFVLNALWGGQGTGLRFVMALIKPVFTGNDWGSWVTWFFTTLAVVRLLGWLFQRHKILFLSACLAIAGLMHATQLMHYKNWYDSQNWPIVTMFFIVGMHVPKNFRVLRHWGLCALGASLLLTWFNVPDFFTSRPCLLCHLDFKASLIFGAAAYGGFGTIPVFIAAELLMFIFALWAAETASGRLARWLRYFGRLSLQALLLEGVWMAVIDTYLWWYHSNRMSPGFAIVLVLVPVGHYVALKLFEPWLTGIVMWCSKVSERLLSRAFWWDVLALRAVLG